MLSVFKMAQALDENASGHIIDVDAHKFYGSMTEMASEFNFTLMSEAADIMSYYTNAEEIMTESAMSNPSALGPMSENVLDNLGNKLKAFIDKIIAMVKGVIDKLKAFFFKFTGKTADWLKVMRPRITAAAGRQGASDFQVEAHEWDVEYITSGMSGGIDTLMSIATKTNDKFDRVAQLSASLNAVKGNLNPDMQGKSADDAGVSAAVDALDKAVEAAKADSEKTGDEMATAIANAMGVTEGVSSLEEVWGAVAKKANGGDKVTVKVGDIKCGKFGNSYDGMLKAIEESKKTISAIQKSYDNHLKTLKSLRSKADAAFKADSKVEKLDKYPTDVKTKYNAAVSAYSSIITKEISMTETAVNQARAKNTSALETMTSEYMGILSKFAGFKGKKED